MNSSEYDGHRVGFLIRRKVKKCGGYIKASKESGVEKTALFRAAQGGTPDGNNLSQLYHWLTGRHLSSDIESFSATETD